MLERQGRKRREHRGMGLGWVSERFRDGEGQGPKSETLSVTQWASLRPGEGDLKRRQRRWAREREVCRQRYLWQRK